MGSGVTPIKPVGPFTVTSSFGAGLVLGTFKTYRIAKAKADAMWDAAVEYVAANKVGAYSVAYTVLDAAGVARYTRAGYP